MVPHLLILAASCIFRQDIAQARLYCENIWLILDEMKVNQDVHKDLNNAIIFLSGLTNLYSADEKMARIDQAINLFETKESIDL